MWIRRFAAGATLLTGTLICQAATAQSRPVSFKGVTANLTPARANALGLLKECQTANHDRRLRFCTWNLSSPYTGTIVFKDGVLETAEVRLFLTGPNRDAELQRHVPALLRDVQNAAGTACSVTTPGTNSRFVTFNSQRQWCFSDARVTAVDSSSNFLGASRSFTVKLSVLPLIVNARKVVVEDGPIEKDIGAALVSEMIALNPDLRRQPGVSDAYFQSHPLLGDLWYSSINVHDRRCLKLAPTRFNCSFGVRYIRTPQGALNSALGQLAGHRETTVRRQHTNYIVTLVGNTWRSPTAAAAFAAEKAKAAASSRASRDWQRDNQNFIDGQRANERKQEQCLRDAWNDQVMAFC